MNDMDNNYNIFRFKELYIRRINYLNIRYVYSLLENKKELKYIFDNISSFFKQGILFVIYKNNFL